MDNIVRKKYAQILVIARCRDVVQLISTHLIQQGHANMAVLEGATPESETYRERFASGSARIAVATHKTATLRFAAPDGLNLILFFDAPRSEVVYKHHTAKYGVYRVLTFLTEPRQYGALAKFITSFRSYSF